MAWRSRIRQWVGTAILVALAGGPFWMVAKHAERAGVSPAAALGEAMSKAAHQRQLTSLRPLREGTPGGL